MTAPAPIALEVGARLRAVRKAKGLSLDDVEQASQGRVRASVLGAYERGNRALTLPRLQEVAAFYDVPIATLFGTQAPSGPTERRLSFDLDALACSPLTRLRSFVRSIAQQRGDYSGRVLTLRRDDTPAVMTLLCVDTRDAAFEQLDAWGVLAGEPELIR